MARKGEVIKHPAISAKYDQTEVAERVKSDLKTMPEWGRINDEMRDFLAAYCFSRDVLRACQIVGKPLSWVESKTDAGSPFRDLMMAACNAPRDLALELIEDMLPMSMYRLRQMVLENPETSASKKVQLEAIKHMHTLAGILPSEQQGKFIGQMMNVKIEMFGRNGNKPEGD